MPDFFDSDGGELHRLAAATSRDTVVKPLLIVLAAVLVGAAVAKAQKPEPFIAAHRDRASACWR